MYQRRSGSVAQALLATLKRDAAKAKRAAERAAATTQASAAAAEDHATDNYGQETHETKLSADAIEISLKTPNDERLGKKVKLRAFLQNARMQGAKMTFVVYLNLPSVHLAAYFPRTPKRLLP
ncbi:hypothetical protein B0T21DRAFT_410958 [Apiosordaria backusii]|uniref:Uncharacterized protein n=1 Tax=Apiosordaria backusii TaxID=314023 RepID=A0AA40BNJ0_9PEZI|nr:hypothetical protein B0T21DRAFT_410958 [Apiosordaria backusii]